MNTIKEKQIKEKGMSEFVELIKSVSELPKEKRYAVSMYVQGFMARDALEKNKVS